MLSRSSRLVILSRDFFQTVDEPFYHVSSSQSILEAFLVHTYNLLSCAAMLPTSAVKLGSDSLVDQSMGFLMPSNLFGKFVVEDLRSLFRADMMAWSSASMNYKYLEDLFAICHMSSRLDAVSSVSDPVLRSLLPALPPC